MTTAFDVLAEPNRRRILDLLRDGERPVGELVEALAVSQPVVSKHLRVLHDADLVARRREGRHQMYSLQVEPMAEAFEWLSRYRRFWRSQLKRLKRHVEEDGEWA